ncbi:hypothetical protein [Butyricicoccus sp.]|uniref:hypothetical protein n=1 Tax=Butyricicoccus sp. TaxID=2049021 RepID=UPI003D7CDD32
MYNTIQDITFLQQTDLGEESFSAVLKAYKRTIQFIEKQNFDLTGYHLCEFNFLTDPETDKNVGYLYAFIKNNCPQPQTGYFEIWYVDAEHISCFGRKKIKPFKL